MKVYTEPKIYAGTGKESLWYIWFRYKGKLIKKRDDLNRIKDLSVRMREAKTLAKIYHDKLKRDWNPLIGDIEEIDAVNYLLPDALELALEKKKKHIAAISYKNYKNTLKFVLQAINSLNIASIPVGDVKRAHVKKILEVISDERDWSGKAYNKALSHIQSFFTELLQWDIVEYSPADKIRRMPEDESEEKIYLTDRQRLIIKQNIAPNHPEFYRFLMTLYHSGIRPVEITRLKFDMVDRRRRIIKMPPGTGKTRKKKRIVAITQELWEYLCPILEKDFPDDYYLFGSSRIPGRGNEGKFVDFVPGPTQMKRGTATSRYKKLVKDDLGIDVDMYYFKDMGTNDKLLAGVDPDAIQSQLGHSERKTTELYMTMAAELKIRDIQQKSPGF